MDFGLGLVLSFTDNASSGIQNAVNSLNQLTETASNASSSLTGMAQLGAFSVVTNQLGSSFVSAGQSILSTFTQIIGKVNETGQTLMYAENQLDKLYEGSSRTGKDVLGDISQYAKQSIFEFEDLIPVVTMLKANGIEAFDMIASSTGKANQTLMDYAADLAAFNPQMRNAYGTGIKAAMGALNEYIAEGNAMSLKRGASLDITSILGEDKGATIEERSRQVADLMEKLNMVGMTAQLAETPMVKLSNMSDTLFQFLGMIAQSGVYDKFNDIIGVFADFINNIPSDELQAVANSIGSALADLLKPIEWLAEKIVTLARGFKDLVSNNPEIAKFVILGTALTGVLLLLSGIALKVASSIGMLTIGLNSFGGSFSTITTLLKGGAMKILGTLLPLTATIGLVYLAWKSDFGGIRTLLTQFISNIRGAFDTARQALNMNVNDMMITVNNLQNTGDFWSNITVGLIKIGTLWQALSDAWNDYTLSEDVYLKCKELGILPLVEAILNLKYRFDLFKEGFIQGWRDISTRVQSFIEGIAVKCKGTIFEDTITGATEFFQLLSSGDADAWYQFGYSFAEFTAKAIAFWAVFKVVDGIIGKVIKVSTAIGGIGRVLSGVGNIGSKVFGALQKAFPYLSGAVRVLFTNIVDVFDVLVNGNLAGTTLGGIAEAFRNAITGASKLKDALTAVFGGTATVVAGILTTVVGAVTAIFNFVSMLKEGFSWIKEALMVLGIALAAVGAIILGAPALIAGVVAGIVALVATLVVVIKDHWEQIKTFLGNIATWIDQNIIQPVIDFFSPMFDLIGQMWESFMGTVQHVVDRVKGFIGELVDGIKSIWDNIMSYISPCIDTFNELKDTFLEFCQFVGGKLSELGGAISSWWTGTVKPVLSAVGNFISGVFSAIWNKVTEVWNGIWNTISPIVMAIWNTIQSVFTSIFDTIMNVLSNIWQGIVGVFNGIVTFVGSILSGIFQTISNVLMGIMNFIMGKHEEAKQNFSNAWNAIKGIVTGALNGIIQVITSIFTAIGGVISSIWNGIVSFFSTIWSGITTIFSTALSSISSVVSSIFNSIKSVISSVLNTIKGVVSSVWSSITSTFSSAINTAKSVVTGGINAIKSGFTSGLNAVKSTVSSVFDGIKSKISSVMEGAKNIVSNAVSKFKSAFNFSWKLPDLKLPHVSVSGGEAPFGIAGKGSLPKFSVDWYAEGGVFNKPSVIGVGEAGTEAVMPLENNTGWISELAFMISKQIMGVESRQFVPTDSAAVSNNTSTVSEDRYMTSNVTNNNTKTGDTDNSVNFAEGAIQINCQNASEEEALRMAKVIMEYIKRQKELDKMLAYG